MTLRITFLLLGLSIQLGFSQNLLSPNEISLGQDLDHLAPDLFLLTGEEPLFQRNEWLRESLLRNIRNGIREGYYEGKAFIRIEGKEATQSTFFFYQKKLYKVRWTFQKVQYSNLKELGDTLNQWLENRFGTPSEHHFEFYRVWRSGKFHLQSFYEEREFQIEYRDEEVQKIIEKLED